MHLQQYLFIINIYWEMRETRQPRFLLSHSINDHGQVWQWCIAGIFHIEPTLRTLSTYQPQASFRFKNRCNIPIRNVNYSVHPFESGVEMQEISSMEI